MKHKLTVLNLILILVLCLSFITPFVMPTPVLAAEEEEEDNFTTMPNYRWENQSTTDSAVSERLIGDNYEVYNYNNQTSGTQKFEKSRQLNSRDFYYESRFALDVGGNQTEYFRDQVGDACDFEEGDVEDWIVSAGSYSVDNGLLDVFIDGDWGGVHILPDPDISQDVSTGVRFKIRSTWDDDLLARIICYHLEGGYFYRLLTLTTEWTVIDFEWGEFGFRDADERHRLVNQFRIQAYSTEDEYPNGFYLDYFEVYGNLDYATQVEGEIENTWDWEDSQEYWYTEEGNVSDFNDGTTEGWEAVGSEILENLDGWLNVSENHIELAFAYAGLSIDASVYKYFAMELYVDTGTVDYITVKRQNPYEAIYQDLTDVAEGSYYLLNGEFDSDWTGTETDVRLYVVFKDAQYNELHINMTYLYDSELGDLEGFTGNKMKCVQPEGFLSFTNNAGTGGSSKLSIPSGLTIDTDLFEILKIKMKSISDDSVDFEIQATIGTDKKVAGASFDNKSWHTWTFILSDDEDWIGIATKLLIRFDEQDEILEGDERIVIDYFLLLGHWSETDGFKFSLLNSDDEEGMSFQFTGNADNSYDISIDMYDSVGVALDYEYSFDYSIDTDGWLRIRVEWHLDKRNVRVFLEYDNGTDILKVQRITDLYGGNLGVTRLLLLEEGFPSLCMNNSIAGFARSYVIINYIDADWEIVAWREPASPVYTNYWGSKTNYADSYFTSVSPYGINVYHKSRGDTYKFYQLCVDRFDGLSFDISIETSGLDSGDYNDWTGFVLSIYNIQADGTAMFVGEVATAQLGGTPGTVFLVYNRTGDIVLEEQVLSTRENIELDVSFWHEDREKSILQFHYLTETFDVRKQFSFGHEFTENFTKEYMFIFGYGYRTNWNGAANDEIDTLMGAFELIRKDLIGDLVALVFSPIVDMLAIIFSPLILLFQILTIALVKGFKQLSVALEPFFDILGNIIGVAIGVLATAIGSLMDDLETLITGILDEIVTAFGIAVGAIWTLLMDFGTELAAFIIVIAGLLFPVLAEVINAIIGFIMAVLDFFWTSFLAGTPIGFLIEIAIEAILAAPEIFMGIINLFIFWQFWILIGIWIIVLPMQAAQCEGISDFLERILGIFCIDALPIEIMGIGLWFPLAIPLVFWTCANIIVLV